MLDVKGAGGQLRTPEPVLTSHLFPEILEQLLDVLNGLTQSQWQSPTVCDKWCVKDVALHMLGLEIGNLSSRRDSHQLTAPVSDWQRLVGFVDDLNQSWVSVARRISTPLLVDLLEHTGGQMCDYVSRLDPAEIGGPVSWVGPEAVPVWLDIAREYTERWCHQQHIRDAVGEPGLCEPRYLAPVLSTFSRALPRALGSVDARDGATVTLTVSGASGGEWSARRESHTWRLYEGSLARADATVRVDEDTAWRLFTRGLTRKQARELVVLSGERSLAEPVLDLVAIIA